MYILYDSNFSHLSLAHLGGLKENFKKTQETSAIEFVKHLENKLH